MDASDPKQVRKAIKEAKIAERQRQATISNLMSTIAGRAFVYDLLAGCHVFTSSFALNALQMGFNEGERNVGLKLLGDIMQVCPESYTLMMREYNARPSTNRDDRGSPEDDSDGSSGEQPGSEEPGRQSEGSGSHRDPDAPDPHGYYKN